MKNNDLKERDFHHGEGHAIPIFIKIAWIILISWALFYLFTYSFPNLKLWLK